MVYFSKFKPVLNVILSLSLAMAPTSIYAQDQTTPDASQGIVIEGSSQASPDASQTAASDQAAESNQTETTDPDAAAQEKEKEPKTWYEEFEAQIEKAHNEELVDFEKEYTYLEFAVKVKLNRINEQVAESIDAWMARSSLNPFQAKADYTDDILSVGQLLQKRINNQNNSLLSKFHRDLINRYFRLASQSIRLKMLIDESKSGYGSFAATIKKHELSLSAEAFSHIYPPGQSPDSMFEITAFADANKNDAQYRLTLAIDNLIPSYISSKARNFDSNKNSGHYLDVVKCLSNFVLTGKLSRIQVIAGKPGIRDLLKESDQLCPGLSSALITEAYDESAYKAREELHTKRSLFFALPGLQKDVFSEGSPWRSRYVALENLIFPLQASLTTAYLNPSILTLNSEEPRILNAYEYVDLQNYVDDMASRFVNRSLVQSGDIYYRYVNPEIGAEYAEFLAQSGLYALDKRKYGEQAHLREGESDPIFAGIVESKLVKAELLTLSGFESRLTSEWTEPVDQLRRLGLLQPAIARLLVQVKLKSLEETFVRVAQLGSTESGADKAADVAQTYFEAQVKRTAKKDLESFFASTQGQGFLNTIASNLEAHYRSMPFLATDENEYISELIVASDSLHVISSTTDLSQLNFDSQIMQVALHNHTHHYDSFVRAWMHDNLGGNHSARVSGWNQSLDQLRDQIHKDGHSTIKCEEGTFRSFIRGATGIVGHMLGIGHGHQAVPDTPDKADTLTTRYCQLKEVGMFFGLSGFSAEPTNVAQLTPEMTRNLGEKATETIIEAYRQALKDSYMLNHRVLGVELKGGDAQDPDMALPLFSIISRYSRHFDSLLPRNEEGVIPQTEENQALIRKTVQDLHSNIRPWMRLALNMTEQNIINQIQKISSAQTPDDIKFLIRDTQFVNVLLGEEALQSDEAARINMLSKDSSPDVRRLNGVYPGLLSYHQNVQMNMEASSYTLENLWDEFTYASFIPFGYILVYFIGTRIHPRLGGVINHWTRSSLKRVAMAYMDVAIYGVLSADIAAAFIRRARVNGEQAEFDEMTFTEAESDDLALLPADHYTSYTEFNNQTLNDLNWRIGLNAAFLTLPLMIRAGASRFDKYISQPLKTRTEAVMKRAEDIDEWKQYTKAKQDQDALVKAWGSDDMARAGKSFDDLLAQPSAKPLTRAEELKVLRIRRRMIRRMERLEAYHKLDFKALGFETPTWDIQQLKQAFERIAFESLLKHQAGRINQAEQAYKNILSKAQQELSRHAGHPSTYTEAAKVLFRTDDYVELNRLQNLLNDELQHFINRGVSL